MLVEEHGVQLRKLPNDVLTELHRISEDVVSEMSSVDEQTAKVYESWKNFRDNVINYNRIAEEAFIEARNLPLN